MKTYLLNVSYKWISTYFYIQEFIWIYPTQWKWPPRSHRLPNESPSAKCGILPLTWLVSGVPKIPQTIRALTLLLVALQNLMVRSYYYTYWSQDMEKPSGIDQKAFSLLDSFHSIGRCYPVFRGWEGVINSITQIWMLWAAGMSGVARNARGWDSGINIMGWPTDPQLYWRSIPHAWYVNMVKILCLEVSQDLGVHLRPAAK